MDMVDLLVNQVIYSRDIFKQIDVELFKRGYELCFEQDDDGTTIVYVDVLGRE